MENWLDILKILPEPILAIAIGIISGLLLVWVINFTINQIVSRGHSKNLVFFRKRCKDVLTFFIPVTVAFISLQIVWAPDWMLITFRTLVILSISLLLIRFTYIVEDVMLDKYNISKKEDNKKERKILTQLNFVKNAAILMIIFLTIGALLLSFEGGQKFGAGLLTSAGVASVIIGFAAQKTIANFLAGVQVAFTQPMKIDDAVLVENDGEGLRKSTSRMWW